MGWPSWVDEIARRYLADEASVFVVYGDVTARQWSADDVAEPLDAAKLLVRFLRRSREVVAVLHPGPPPARLEFAEYTDRARFETLVRAADVLAGKALALNETDPMHCLGRIWRALSTHGTAQGYVVADTERLLPAAKKWLDPVPGAPELKDWAAAPQLRRSNNLVIFLCRSLDGVRADFLAGPVATVALRAGDADQPEGPRAATPTTPATEPDEPSQAEAPAEGVVGDVPVALAPAPEGPPASEPQGPTLHDELEAALVECLGVHGEESRPARVPVMDAVARVIAARDPGRFGALAFSFDPAPAEEGGGVKIEGDGADAFRATWSSDIALDASAGMILGKLPVGYKVSGASTFDATGMKALVRRVERILSRP